MIPHSTEKKQLIDISALFYQRNWSVGTSSNYSLKLRDKPLRILITASGKDKRALTIDDFVEVNESGQPVQDGAARPSAETMLHVVALQQPNIQAVLHTHSVWSTILSTRSLKQGFVEISGFEMLKGLEGIATHETSVRIRIFENTQDMKALSAEVQKILLECPEELRYGFLLHGHGLYTWGKDLFSARRHVEILEFLFEVQGRMLSMQ
ncbi:MAG: methylthioribulose 1-phosphate dehydratase [Planctomycetia bacterium]|nr:methylthioribulose 1-phosphate dehydratase [Planctomycetia bacterium]